MSSKEGTSIWKRGHAFHRNLKENKMGRDTRCGCRDRSLRETLVNDFHFLCKRQTEVIE